RRFAARACELAVVLAGVGALLLWCSVPNTRPLATENPTSTAFIDLRRAEARAAGRAFELRWEWRPIGKISRFLRAAVIYAEDDKFFRHDGVDWDAIEDAIESNWERDAMAVGGSTITQQLAKNLYLSPRRSLVRKAREMLIAYALEDHLSKTRLLEIYLNIAEWGDGVFGAEAAARRWYGRSAQQLTPAQAVRLAIALPNPFTRAPTVNSSKMTKKAVRIIRLLRLQGLIDAAQERVAFDEVGAQDVPVVPDRRARVPAEPGPVLTPSDPAP
nr:monofunctional biosynthetic peptidoglycan transglycosylase [Deltaproteobacteria bacterium]